MSGFLLRVRPRKRFLRPLLRFALFAAPSVALLTSGVLAQTFPQSLPNGITVDQLRQQLGQTQSPAVPPLDGGAGSASVTLQPDASRPVVTAPSRLEQILSSRAGVELRQFGYNQFGTGRSLTLPQTGAVQDDYVLGAGDEIVASLRGQENSEVRVIVDRNGQVLLPRLNPISAAGRSFGSFRQDVEAAVSRAYVATSAFVSVARVRQISVLVTGEVNAPGQRLVTGLASALDAILLSGGVKKSGSLRNVRLQRGGREHVVDLYAILTGSGSASSMRLADGDRIRVPLLGPTVAVSGLVRQPGIFELPSGQRSITIANLMALAGGEEVRGRYRLSVLRVEGDGRTRLVDVAGTDGTISDSEILFVQPGADETVNRATLGGGVGLAGSYAITEATRLSQILRSPGALGRSPYTLFGLVARRDPRTLMRTLVAFTPVAVLNGAEDMALQTEDFVRIISVEEMAIITDALRQYQSSQAAQQHSLRNPTSGAANNAQGDAPVARSLLDSAQMASNVSANQADAVRAVTSRSAQDRDAGGNNSAMMNRQGEAQMAAQGMAMQGMVGQQFQDRELDRELLRQQPGQREDAPWTADFQRRVVPPGGYALNREAETFQQLALQLGVNPVVLINFLLDHQVTVSGAVRGPGTFIVGPSVLLSDLVVSAGGTVNWIDGSNLEVISTAIDASTGRSQTRRMSLPVAQSLASYVVKPRDEFRFNAVFTDTDVGNITIQGEVRFPGSYKLTRGERLSDLLARAGGLTTGAYPYGTVFLRKSVAAVERDGYMRTAKEIEEQLMAGMTRAGPNRIEPAAFASMQSFVRELRNQQALGRIAIVADPSVLASRPDQDPLLEADDVIYIPQRPSTISVLGQVMQPGSFPFRAGESVSDYIARAGGYGRFADSSQTFVVLPDGTARKIESSWLRFEAASALPPGSAIVVPRDLMPFDLRQTLVDVSAIVSQFAVGIASIAVLSRN